MSKSSSPAFSPTRQWIGPDKAFEIVTKHYMATDMGFFNLASLSLLKLLFSSPENVCTIIWEEGVKKLRRAESGLLPPF